jgi:hypothetical protein
MQIPGPIGPAWNLRLFRRVCLGTLLGTIAVMLICLGLGLFPQAAVCATSALFSGCYWQFVRHFTTLMERWIRRPGYRPIVLFLDRRSANSPRLN